jgi:hypothetical protein
MSTHTITLNLPEPLYQRLNQRSQQLQRSLEEELIALLSTKVPATKTGEKMPLATSEVVEFLGRGASAQEIAEFRLSSAAQTRAKELLQKNRDESLTPAEEAELEAYVELEDFMGLIKLHALQQLQGN